MPVENQTNQKAAERQRTYRRRCRDGRMTVLIELDQVQVDALVEAGFLDLNFTDSRAHVADAVQHFLALATRDGRYA